MNKESRKITEFNPGDIVTRIEPAVIINKGMFCGHIDYDSSYIGDRMMFIGVANGCAYFEPTDEFEVLIQRGKMLSLKLSRFDSGWDYYLDPGILLLNPELLKYRSMIDAELDALLDNLVLSEEYEEASRVKHEIDRRAASM